MKGGRIVQGLSRERVEKPWLQFVFVLFVDALSDRRTKSSLARLAEIRNARIVSQSLRVTGYNCCAERETTEREVGVLLRDHQISWRMKSIT